MMITSKFTGVMGLTKMQIYKLYQEIIRQEPLLAIVALQTTKLQGNALILLFLKWENTAPEHGQLERLIYTPIMEQQSIF